MSYSDSVEFVLGIEGGVSNNPNDRGGETNYGISQWAFNEARNRNIIHLINISTFSRKLHTWRK